jgi:cell volume regulation protein A
MNIHQVLSQSPRAILLALLGFLFSLSVITVFMTYLVGVPLLHGILFGSIFGGSSSIAVISLAHKINVSEKCSTILTLESAITDIMCIVISLAVLGIILTGQVDYLLIARDVAAKFLIGAFVGSVLGLLWLILLKRIANLSYSYMLTLSVVLFGYTISEYLGGSGALSSLLFGLMLGNEGTILAALKRQSQSATIADEVAVDAGLRRFESEIAFLIRTFFFVFLGLIAMISHVWFVFVGAILSLLLLLVRFGAVSLVTLHSELRDERPVMGVVLTRGLAAAVLATLPLQYDLPFSSLYVSLAVIIIMSTALIATIGTFVLGRKGKRR